MNCPICKYKESDRACKPCSECNKFNKWEPDDRYLAHVRLNNEISLAVAEYEAERAARPRVVRFSSRLMRYISNGGTR